MPRGIDAILSVHVAQESSTPISITLRASGAINIHTDVQHDSDNLEVASSVVWDEIVAAVNYLQTARKAIKERE